MTIKRNKSTYIIIVLLIFLIFNIFVFYKKQTESSLNNVPTGNIEFGVYNKENKIIDNGTTISYESDIIKHQIEITQNLQAKREYKLIVLVDFIQTNFIVDGKEYESYNIFLNEKDAKKINIKIKNIPQHAHELDYIIIKNPNYKVSKNEIERAHILQEIMSLRYKLLDESVDISYKKNYIQSTEKPLDNIFVSYDENKLTIPTIIKQNQNLFTVLGNFNNTTIDYAVILLKDWKQINIRGEDKVEFFKLMANQRIYFPLNNSSFKVGSNYQLIAFSNPFKFSLDDYNTLNVYASHRFNII